MRIIDKSKKLNFEQLLQLVNAKGVKYFEDDQRPERSCQILMECEAEYLGKIGYIKGDASFYLCLKSEFVANDSDADGRDKIFVFAILPAVCRESIRCVSRE